MFVAALRSFPPAHRHIFVCLRGVGKPLNFEKVAKKHFPDSCFVFADKPTEGPASTCLLAQKYLEPNENLLISSIDYQIVYDYRAFNELTQDNSVDVIIFTFFMGHITKKSPEAFAYCHVQGDLVSEVVEKKTISDTPWRDHAVVGTFFYKKCEDFILGANQMIQKNIRVNNEFYVGTSINQLIELGKKVVVFPVNKFISFGDPFELEIYRYWEDFFAVENVGLNIGG